MVKPEGVGWGRRDGFVILVCVYVCTCEIFGKTCGGCDEGRVVQRAWGKPARREKKKLFVPPESSKEARATGRTDKAIMTQKSKETEAVTLTPWSASKSTVIVGWCCGTGQLID